MSTGSQATRLHILLSPRGRIGLCLALLSTWTASLFLHVATTDHVNAPQDFAGWSILMLGWLGPLDGLQFGWWANPLLMMLLVLKIVGVQWSWKADLAAGLAMLALIANASFWSRIPDDSGSNYIVSFGPGYYLWMATMTVVAIWMLSSAWLRRQGSEQ